MCGRDGSRACPCAGFESSHSAPSWRWRTGRKRRLPAPASRGDHRDLRSLSNEDRYFPFTFASATRERDPYLGVNVAEDTGPLLGATAPWHGPRPERPHARTLPIGDSPDRLRCGAPTPRLYDLARPLGALRLPVRSSSATRMAHGRESMRPPRFIIGRRGTYRSAGPRGTDENSGAPLGRFRGTGRAMSGPSRLRKLGPAGRVHVGSGTLVVRAR